MFVSKMLRTLHQDRRGVASLEYALLTLGAAMGLLTALPAVAAKMSPLFASLVHGFG
ncbi:MAG: hypothetical protein KGJ41_14655 [Rhodospirillales bacterium]|nr:hypothetical protein [Rhodospirillales bacterium]MDE2200255.1 hypothetical protein [Rhodospirillales bacterium]MDE2574612.1 hypothetical protein [Rhodospirillales bacterium]